MRKLKANESKQELNPDMLQILIEGLSSLLEGQRQFVMEFGMSMDRVMPHTSVAIQGKESHRIVRSWLESKTGDGITQLHHLFAELMDHQLALIAALDGIALQTMREVLTKRNSHSWLQERMQTWTAHHKIPKKIAQLEMDQQLRYQKLIAPGLVDAYLWTLEKIRQSQGK